MLKEQRTLKVSQATDELRGTPSRLRFGGQLGPLPLARRSRAGWRCNTPEGVHRLRRLGAVKKRERSLEGGMSKPRLVYTPRQDATRDGELNALAAVYKLILDSAEERAAHPRDPEDGKEMNECLCGEESRSK